MLKKLDGFTASHGELRRGSGLVTGTVALALATFFLGVLTFHCLVGTAVNNTKLWPQPYGVLGDDVPDGFFKQLQFPIVWKG